MRWLHVLGQLRSGGVEHRLMWTIRALGPGYQHLVVSLDGSTDVFDAALDLHGRTRVIPATGRPSTLATMRWLQRVVKMEQPDAVLSYGWGGFDAVLTSVLSRSRVPCIHHEDGFTAEEVAHMPRRRTLARRACLPRIAATIVPSTVLAGLARAEWKIPANRLVHVPNGVPRRTGSGRVSVRAELGLAEDSVVAVMAGRLAAVKRVDIAIDAAHAAGVPLVILGDGPERAALEQQRARLGSWAYFAGNQKDVRPWLRGADIYLSTSSSEQHPLAMLEAMDEGLAVVATDVGDVGLSLPDAQRVFVAGWHGAADAIRGSLASLADDAALRAALGDANRIHLEQHYRFETAVVAVEAAIRSRTLV